MKKRERRRLRVAGLKAIFNDTCVDCGYHKYPEILEFHHVIPREISGLKRMRNVIDRDWESCRDEIVRECVLLCPTCHKLRHMVLDGKLHGRDNEF